MSVGCVDPFPPPLFISAPFDSETSSFVAGSRLELECGFQFHLPNLLARLAGEVHRVIFASRLRAISL